MADKRKGTKKLKITFINPNSSKSFEKLLRLVIVEKIKNKRLSREKDREQNVLCPFLYFIDFALKFHSPKSWLRRRQKELRESPCHKEF